MWLPKRGIQHMPFGGNFHFQPERSDLPQDDPNDLDGAGLGAVEDPRLDAGHADVGVAEDSADRRDRDVVIEHHRG